MNTKTTKFLAVLAVLAIAFAGCAILMQGQDNEAVAGEAVTKDTYAQAYAAGNFKSIKLETTAASKSVVLYSSTTTIVAGDAYFFAENTTVSIPETVTSAKPVMFFVLDGVKLNVIGPNKDITGTYGMVQFVNVKSYDAFEGVITLDAARTVADDTLFDEIGYAKGLTTVTAVYAAADLKVTYEKKDFFGITADKTANPNKKFVLSGITTLDAWGDMVLTGSIETVNVKAASELTFENFTGTIVSTADVKVKVKDFTGIIDGTTTTIIVSEWTDGQILTSAGITINPIEIEEGQSISFAKGVAIPEQFEVRFQRYVSYQYNATPELEAHPDLYRFHSVSEMTAGVGGFTITAGTNGFELSGNVTATAAVTWTFVGAAYITGTIDAAEVAVTVTGDGIYDVTFGSATIFTTGLVLTNGATIDNGAVVNVRNNVTIPEGKTLKVGEEAYVRVYETLALATATSSMYTAGNVVADNVTLAGADVTAATDLAKKVYVYKDGSLTGSNVKFTKVDKARMANVTLLGSGDLGINGVSVTDEKTYYVYSFIAFYPISTQDVLSLAADSRIVGGIVPIATITESEVNLPLLYAKYKINYDAGTPTFLIEYKETYAVALEDVNTTKGYTITDSNGDEVFVDADGVAMLIYGETYSLKGKVGTSKYTYTSDLNEVLEDEILQPIDFQTNTLTTFTMVRSEQTISVEIGEKQTITVTLNQTDSPFAVGDELLAYSTDDGETYKTAKLALKDNKLQATFDVFNTDFVLVQFADRMFFVSTVNTIVAADKITDRTDEITEDEADAGWTFAFTGVADQTKGSFTVTCGLAVTNDTYKLVDPDALVGNLKITVTFDDYYTGTSGHKQSYDIVPTAAGAALAVETYVGETYTMTWTNLDDVKETMTYGEDKKYTQGDLVTIADGTEYTLTLAKITYADVKNNTETDLTVIFGETTVDVPAGETLSKGIITGTDYITLASKGKEVVNWTGTFKHLAGGTVDITGSGATSTAAVEITEGGLFTISTVKTYNIIYLVTVEPVDHGSITYYYEAGYYGRDMVVYVQPDSGYNVVGVKYTYQEQDMEAPVTKEATKMISETQEYWGYVMPASDVLLKPIIEKNEYDIKIYDQDGVLLETTKYAPHADVELEIGDLVEYATVVKIETDPEVDFTYDARTGIMSFEMPADDLTITATYEDIIYSTNVAVAITPSLEGLIVTVSSLDGYDVMPGSITLICTYWYFDEEDEVWDTMTVKLDGDVEGDSIVTSCIFDYDDMPEDTDYVQALYDSLAVDGDSGMIVYI
jgi:hypothetical protein